MVPNEAGRSLALVDGHIRPTADDPACHSAVLFSGGHVAGLGRTAQVLAACDASTEIIDLAGRTVLPGFIDAHTHVETSAYATRHWVDVRGLQSDRTLAVLRDVLATVKPGTWIVAQGTYGQDQPTRAELDAIAPANPTIVRTSMHRLMANSAALAAARISPGAPSPIGVRIHLDDAGAPTGLIDEGFNLFPVDRPDGAALAELLRGHLLESFAARGVTTIYEIPQTADGIRAYQSLKRTGRLPVRLAIVPTVRPGINPLVDSVETLADLGWASGFGDERLWFGGAKLFLDGDADCAWDTANSHPKPAPWGRPLFDYGEIVASLTAGHRAGIQVWMHAIGDLAQHAALDAIAEARRISGPGDYRTRLEHVANLWVDDNLLRRLTDLAVIPVPTAGFLHADDGKGAYAYRSLIDAGLTPPGNSDNGGTQPFATNPWHGITAMLKRVNRDGVPVRPDQATTLPEAIATYTSFAAYAGFREASLGSLRPGWAADAIVLPADPFQLPVGELISLRPDLTIVDGTVVYDASHSHLEA